MPEHSRGNENEKEKENNPIIHAKSLDEQCHGLYDRVSAFLAEDAQSQLLRNVQEQSRTSLGAIEEALRRYSLEQLCLSYNGGKDCLVLLVLYLVALYSHYRGVPPLSSQSTATSHTSPSQPVPTTPESSATAFPQRLNTVYIQHPHSFSEVDDFVQTSVQYYHMTLTSSTLPMKAAFAQYLEQHKEVKAIFVGTRRTDPHGAILTHFDPTDSGWPPFMRIHPVIDWHYTEIWAFIKHLDIPYCALYDLGYTSLGGTNDTHPNPKLQTGGDANQPRYRPAYELTEDDEERLGRDWQKKA